MAPSSSTDGPQVPRHSFAAAAGPLPDPVARQVAAACRGGAEGPSILGLSFVSERYKTLQRDTEAALRRLLGIPEVFRVLFLSGGATAQFAAVPLNLLAGGRAVYVESGHWSRRAREEAGRYGVAIALAADVVAEWAGWRAGPPPAYCHLTSNETADGVQFSDYPAVPVPLAVDMTSDFLTRRIDFDRVALAYAGTQKSIGVSGLTLVIVREDLLGRALPATPRVLDYARQAECDSRVNTPPVFAVFVLKAMLDWIEAQGGVSAMADNARRRSGAVYWAVDDNPALRAFVPPERRSRINPCFHLADPGDTAHFLAAAAAAGLDDLQGHPALGGIRASLYNGLSEAAVTALVGFLDAYAPRVSARAA